MFEDNPTLRERVLGVAAISAVLIGGAAGVDTMLTSGWQLGGASATHVVYADATPQQYFDDVSRDLTTAPPQRVQLASQDAVVTIDPEQVPGGLDGSAGAVALAPSAADPWQQSTRPEPSGDAQQQQAADQRLDTIENDIQQATTALEPDAPTKDASETSSPS